MAPPSSSLASFLLVLAAVSLVAGVRAQVCSQCTKQCKAIVDGSGPCPYPPEDPTYEYFLFVLQWPGTYCQRDPRCCEGKFPEGVDWTIHGLWPEKSQNCYPYCCDLRSVKFKPAAVASLRSDLRKYWPTLSCSNTDDSFHSNEWDKHGTCALKELRNQSSDPVHYYFEKTLELRDALPLGSILRKAKIIPNGKMYSTDDIRAAIYNFTGAVPDLDCQGDGDIDEVHFCLSKDLQNYIDCPLGKGDRKKCKAKTRYPILNTDVFVQ